MRSTPQSLGYLEETPVELVPTRRLVDRLRIVKDADEQRLLQHAVDVVDDCLADVYPRLKPGLTERQVARMIETYFFDHADGPSFPSIVASGPNGSMPHAVPSDRPIEAGEGITIDIGARAGGLLLGSDAHDLPRPGARPASCERSTRSCSKPRPWSRSSFGRA